MTKGTRITLVSAASAALIFFSSACSGGNPEPGSSPPAPSAAESDQVEESNDPNPQDEDPWGDYMWDNHIAGIVEWWNDHYDSGCGITEPDCYEHFSEGSSMLSEFAESGSDSSEEHPEYVPTMFFSHVNLAARSMERYAEACPGESDCADMADGLEIQVYEIIAETDSWWSQER